MDPRVEPEDIKRGRGYLITQTKVSVSTSLLDCAL